LLELQQEKASVTATTWHKKLEEALECNKLKDMENNELQKKIVEEKNKLKLQQALYESVRADRNLFSQQHIEAQDEIAEVSVAGRRGTIELTTDADEEKVQDHDPSNRPAQGGNWYQGPGHHPATFSG
jgi:hypothetical protein